MGAIEDNEGAALAATTFKMFMVGYLRQECGMAADLCVVECNSSVIWLLFPFLRQKVDVQLHRNTASHACMCDRPSRHLQLKHGT